MCIDCADAEALATFYSKLLGWEITARDAKDWRQLRDPGGAVAINIQGEPWYEPPSWPEEPAAQHKMMHFEIEVDDLEAAVAAVIAAGGQQAPSQPEDRSRARLRVMIDPAGHPFCLFLRGE